MEKRKAGRPVDIKGINIDEIRVWLDSTKISRKVIICQAMIALDNGAPMEQVCRVLDVTREGIRLWKEKFRNEGMDGVLQETKRGVPSRLTTKREQELKSALKQPPLIHGIEGMTWTGKKVKQFALVNWGLDINLRTAFTWMAKCK